MLPGRLADLARALRHHARARSSASPATTARRSCSSPRTTCATATSCGPTCKPACCSRPRPSTSKDETVEQFTFTAAPDRQASPRDQVAAAPGSARLARRESAPWRPRTWRAAGLEHPRGAARIPQGHRDEAHAAATRRPVGQVVVFRRPGRGIGVHRAARPARRRRRSSGCRSQGAINVYTREVANHLVTVVGEAPAASVQRIADSGGVPPAAVTSACRGARLRGLPHLLRRNHAMQRMRTAVALPAGRSALPLALAQARELPDFTELVEKQGPAVVNISTTQTVRAQPQRAADPGSGRGRSVLRVLPPLHAAPAARARRRASSREPLARLRLHHQRRRLHPDQRPRRRRRRRDHRAS